jgi:hypothetical protein
MRKYCSKHALKSHTALSASTVAKMKEILKMEENHNLLKEFILSPKVYRRRVRLDRKELLTQHQGKKEN